MFERLQINEVCPEVIDWVGLNLLVKIKQLAVRTAEMHIVLGSEFEDTAFTPNHFNGDYEVQLIARNECLCSDTSTLLVQVEPLQSPFVSCVGTICELDTFFYSSDADCSLFYWTVSSNGTIVNGGGTADDYIEVSWTGGPAGDIELSVDNCTGDYCKSPAMIQIPIMTGNAEITGIDRVCTGAVEAYTIQDYSATYYNWTVVGGNILSGQGTNEINIEWNSTAQLPMDALITVDYENCYLECSGSDDFMVRIVDEFFAQGPVEVCPEEVAEFNSMSLHSNTAVTSNWTLTDDQNAILWSFSIRSCKYSIPSYSRNVSIGNHSDESRRLL